MNTIAPAASADVTAIADRIRACLRRGASDILAIGQDLLRVREMLPYGSFGPWLEAELDLSERTAQRFMRVAARFAERGDTLAELRPSIIYLLSESATPQPVIDAVLRGGIPPTRAAIEQAIQACELAETGDQSLGPAHDTPSARPSRSYERRERAEDIAEPGRFDWLRSPESRQARQVRDHALPALRLAIFGDGRAPLLGEDAERLGRAAGSAVSRLEAHAERREQIADEARAWSVYFLAIADALDDA